MSPLAELVADIARSLVDDKEAVAVSEIAGDKVTVLELKVAEADLGKVIGKQGRTARAIRTILAAAGVRVDQRFVLEILD